MCTPITRSEHVDANNEMPVRIKSLPFSYQSRPPFIRLTVGGHRMADPDDIAPVLVHFSQCRISQIKFSQNLAPFRIKGLAVFKVLYIHKRAVEIQADILWI